SLWLSEHWNGSGVQGHRPDRVSYWTSSDNAIARWSPAFSARVRAEVEVYIIAHGNEDASAGNYIVRHAGGETAATVRLDQGQKSRGWHPLGTFDFAGVPGEGLELRKTGGAMYRAAAARFGVHGGSGQVIQSIVVDTLNAGPLTEPNPWKPVDTTFPDIAGHKHEYAIRRLANRGYFAATAQGRFNPDNSMNRLEFVYLLVHAIDSLGEPRVPGAMPLDPANDISESMQRAQGLRLISSSDETLHLTIAELESMIDQAVEQTRPGVIWIDSRRRRVQGDQLRIATRADAAVALWWFVEEVIESGPPVGEWQLTFIEEFLGKDLDTDVWRSEAGAPGHIMSSRWPENVEVSGGFLRLLTKKESRAGKAWTSGNVWTRSFKQQYGYFEARLRCGNSTGLNNAFWLMNKDIRPGDLQFEIDMTEARHPNQNLISVHDWADEHAVDSELVVTEESTSEHFHVYAAEWTPTRVVFYFNGRKLREVRHDYCHAPSPIRLSSAVGSFAGRVTDALDGTAMEVDYVRVFMPADRRIRGSEEPAAVE
ncbi:MAG: family 16 glycosylhydrolase, partial [Planctomycetota bacterium]